MPIHSDAPFRSRYNDRGGRASINATKRGIRPPRSSLQIYHKIELQLHRLAVVVWPRERRWRPWLLRLRYEVVYREAACPPRPGSPAWPARYPLPQALSGGSSGRKIRVNNEQDAFLSNAGKRRASRA